MTLSVFLRNPAKCRGPKASPLDFSASKSRAFRGYARQMQAFALASRPSAFLTARGFPLHPAQALPPCTPAQRQEAMRLTAWLPALRGWCTVVRSGAKGIARYEAGDGIGVLMSTKEHQQPKLSRSSSRSSSSGSSLRMEEEAVGGATMISAFSRSPS